MVSAKIAQSKHFHQNKLSSHFIARKANPQCCHQEKLCLFVLLQLEVEMLWAL
jgi:hypothetical protein